ncbi:hypothetical protein GCM10009415_14860 [Chitinophaga japonensis]
MLLAACGESRRNTDRDKSYQVLDYVTVGKIMDTVQLPYVIHLQHGQKELVFIGCDHNYDTAHRQFVLIEQAFAALQPQIAFNEGGQLPDSLHYPSMQAAIMKNSETGCLKYLCNEAGIKMVNGDTGDSLEFSITLKKHPREELFLYYVMERLVIPYLYGAYGSRPFEELYNEAIDGWFVKEGFPLTKEERTLTYFNTLYRKYMGRPLELKMTADMEQFDYVNPDCRFCAIGRTSKMVRDSILLDKIDQALYRYDRIIVTFGAGHALAVEPALKQVVGKER